MTNKIVRLLSPTADKSTKFDATITDPLVLTPYSSVYLDQLVLTINNARITVTNGNNLFSIQTTDDLATKQDVTIPTGRYTIGDFLDVVEFALCSAMDFSVVGNQNISFVCSQDDYKFKLELARNSSNAPAVSVEATVYYAGTSTANPSVLFDPATNMIYRNANTGGGYKSWAYGKRMFLRGASQMIFTTSEKQTGGGNLSTHVLGGLVPLESIRKFPDGGVNKDLNEKYFRYGWQCDEGNNVIVLLGNGEANPPTTIDTSVAYAADLQLIITTSKGKVIFSIEDAVGNNLYQSNPYDLDNDEFYAAVSFKNNKDAIRNLIYWSSPFDDTTTELGASISAYTTLQFGATAIQQGCRKLLGYVSNTYRVMVDGTKDPTIIPAENEMAMLGLPSMFQVHLLDTDIESFNSKDGKKSSCIAYIPYVKQVENKIIYQPVNPLIIALNNSYEKVLNRLAIELKTEDGLLPNEETCDIVLVFTNVN